MDTIVSAPPLTLPKAGKGDEDQLNKFTRVSTLSSSSSDAANVAERLTLNEAHEKESSFTTGKFLAASNGVYPGFQECTVKTNERSSGFSIVGKPTVLMRPTLGYRANTQEISNDDLLAAGVLAQGVKAPWQDKANVVSTIPHSSIPRNTAIF